MESIVVLSGINPVAVQDASVVVEQAADPDLGA
jgi:hypothetical protein